MSKTIRLSIWRTVLMAGLTVGCSSCRVAKESSDQDRPAIVLAAFGTSAAEARKVYDHIDVQARERYPGYEIRWAFTSGFVIRKLKEQGIVTQSPEEAVAELREAGFSRVAIQSFHIAPGQEFEELKQAKLPGMRVAIGGPLLASEEDMRRAIEIIAGEDAELRDPSVPVVFAAHGNARHPQFNRQLVRLDVLLRDACPAAQVATVEGEPGAAGLAAAAKLARTAGRVHFIPFMLVAGVHIMEDVMGDDAKSWKQIVAAKSTTCSLPLGRRDGVLELFFSHLDDCLEELAGDD